MIKISSTAFENGGVIPTKYTCDGSNINPPLYIEDIPPNTKSLVLIVDDMDAPVVAWTHWLVWNIDPAVKIIKENSIPDGGILGINDFEIFQYGGPCPPSGFHNYYFRIYALDSMLNLPRETKRADLEKAAQGHIIEKAEYLGRYNRFR